MTSDSYGFREFQETYPVGTRIRYQEDVGTIVSHSHSGEALCVGVHFDNYESYRHSLADQVPQGYGWWLHPSEFDVLPPPKVDLRTQLRTLWEPLL